MSKGVVGCRISSHDYHQASHSVQAVNPGWEL